MDFGGRTIAASGAAIIFISARATTHLASLCRPRIECGWIAILAVTAKSSALCRQSATHIRKPHRTLLTTADAGAALGASFRFIPRELAIKCRRLIESYHAIYGYVGLPDMLWLSDARDIIERDRELTRIFKRAARSRAAKRANDSFLHIATTIVSLEVLARDFSGWGKRFPAAKVRGREDTRPAAATAARLADGSLLLSAARRPSRVRRYPGFLPDRNALHECGASLLFGQRAHDCRLFELRLAADQWVAQEGGRPWRRLPSDERSFASACARLSASCARHFSNSFVPGCKP